MLSKKHELKFLDLARKGYYTVLENGEIYKTFCKSCNSKCFTKLKIYLVINNYHAIRFRYEGKNYRVSVHRIVYSFFKGEIPDGMQINHKDGNNQNNAILNLEIVTPRENILHGIYITKKIRYGRKIFNPLTPFDIGKILYYRKMHSLSFAELAEKFGVSKTHVSNICRFTNWRALIDRDAEFRKFMMRSGQS